MSTHFNAFSKAIRDVFLKIPSELLTMAFMQDMYQGYADNRSLDERIIDTIIRGHVMPDCNASTGPLAQVDMSNMSPITTATGYIFNIPLDRTNGRRITNVLYVSYTNAETMAYGNSLTNTEPKGLGSLLNNYQRTIMGNIDTNSPWASLIGPNTVLVQGVQMLGNLMLHCQIEHDSELANIPPHGHQTFADLVVAATKVFIHTRLSIRIGEGAINGGSMNGYMRSVLDEYASAVETYAEKKLEWEKVAMFSDERAYTDLLELQMYT